MTPPSPPDDDRPAEDRSDERPDEPSDRAIDRDFARFVERGDDAAFARVFDQASPRLLLIAWRLVGDAQAVEDLVQTVFLEAIRSADRFEPGRPVMPWLRRILVHRLERVVGRRSTHIDADGVGSERHSPERQALESDLAELVDREIGRLPVAVRTTVRLRVLNGLGPSEIAAALEIPIGTVHSHLHRGLRKLRARLPAGIAGAVLGSLAVPTSAAIRARVLESAASMQPLGAAAPLAPVTYLSQATILMSKKTLAIAILIAAVFGTGLVLLDQESNEAPDVPKNESAALDSRTADSPAGNADGSGEPGPSRSDVPGDSALRAFAIGRLVDDATGAPVVGASITSNESTGAVAARSDEQGAFRVELPDRSDTSSSGLGLLVEHPRFVDATIRLGSDDTGNVDLGAVPMLRSVEVVFEIRDSLGALVAGYPLQVLTEMTDRPFGGADGPRTLPKVIRNSAVETDAGGRTPPLRLRRGAWIVSGGNGFGPAYHLRFLGIGGHEREIVKPIVLPPEDPVLSFRGSVRDEGGEAVPGIAFRLVPDNTAPDDVAARDHGLRVVTRDDGRFWATAEPDARRRPTDLPYRIVIDEPGLRLMSPTEAISAPATGVEIVVGRAEPAAVTIRVVDETGRAIDRVGTVLDPTEARSFDSPALAFEDTADGRIELRDLDPGSHGLVVVVPGATLDSGWARLSFEVAPSGGSQQLTCVIPAHHEVDVIVVDQFGEPWSDVAVRVVGSPFAIDPPQQPIGIGSSEAVGAVHPESISEARSDSSGRATLRIPHGGPGLACVAAAPDGGVTVSVPIPQQAEGSDTGALERQPVEIVLPRRSMLTVRLPIDELRRAWTDSGAALEFSARALGPSDRLDIQSIDEGTIRCLGPTGELLQPQLQVEIAGRAMTLRFDPIPIPRRSDTIEELDPASAMPARLTGRVTVDGRPVSGLQFWNPDHRVSGSVLTIGCEPDGSFDATVFAGSWSVLSAPESLGARAAFVGSIDLQPGSVATLRRDVETATIEIEVVDPDGRPLTGRRVGRGAPGATPGRGLEQATTDGAGRAVFHPTVGEPFDVWVWAAEAEFSLFGGSQATPVATHRVDAATNPASSDRAVRVTAPR